MNTNTYRKFLINHVLINSKVKVLNPNLSCHVFSPIKIETHFIRPAFGLKGFIFCNAFGNRWITCAMTFQSTTYIRFSIDL